MPHAVLQYGVSFTNEQCLKFLVDLGQVSEEDLENLDEEDSGERLAKYLGISCSLIGHYCEEECIIGPSHTFLDKLGTIHIRDDKNELFLKFLEKHAPERIKDLKWHFGVCYG